MRLGVERRNRQAFRSGRATRVASSGDQAPCPGHDAPVGSEQFRVLVHRPFVFRVRRSHVGLRPISGLAECLRSKLGRCFSALTPPSPVSLTDVAGAVSSFISTLIITTSYAAAVWLGSFRSSGRLVSFYRWLLMSRAVDASQPLTMVSSLRWPAFDVSRKSKPIPRWDVHFWGLEDDRKDSTAPHIAFKLQLGGH